MCKCSADAQVQEIARHFFQACRPQAARRHHLIHKCFFNRDCVSAGSLMTTKKGITQQQLDAVVTLIKRQGFAQSTLQCDGEPALVKLVEEIGKQTNLPTRQSPAYSHQSQGCVEGWHRSLLLSSELCCLTSVTDTSFSLLISR